MRKLPTEEHVQLMHAINQAIADGKTVIAGHCRIYGATFHGENLNFLHQSGMPTTIFEVLVCLPEMKPIRAVNLNEIVIRAFFPESTDVEVIYEPTTKDLTGSSA